MLSTFDLANLLRRKLAGEPFPYSFIHEVDVCSAAPEDLVRGREHAPGEPDAWCICSPADRHQSAGSGPTQRRKRKVRGGRSGERWHPEGGKTAILGPDGESVGAYTCTLSYLFTSKNPAGMSPRLRKQRLGWCMLEVGLVQQGGGADHLVLCKVYRSSRTDAETSMEASVPDGGMPCPAPAPASSCRPPMGAEIPSRVAIVRNGSVAAAVTILIDLCGSSIPPAQRMKEMANLVLSLESPVVVLSAMGITTTNIFLAAWKALRCDAQKASEIHELAITKELHLRTTYELGLDRSIVTGPLNELEHRLQCVATMKELTPMTRDYLISFGERTSTKMFSEYLNILGKGTLQEWELRDIANFGGGGSDLTAAIIGTDLGSGEIQVWKDQEIFTCDPNVCKEAIPLPNLTFDEAAELGFFSAQPMKLAMKDGLSVKVKNPYNPQAPGTVITKTRYVSKNISFTGIALKSNIIMLDIERISQLGQPAFVDKAVSIFQNFEDLGISVDWVATSEGKMSFTLVPSKLQSQELIQMVLDNAVEQLHKIGTVDRLNDRSIISLIGNTQMSMVNLGRVLNVLESSNVAVEKVSQGSPKVTKISLVVHNNVAKQCVQVLHSAFFKKGLVSEVEEEENGCRIPENSCTSASSSVKRKAEAPLGGIWDSTETETAIEEFVEGALLFHNDDPAVPPVEGDNLGDLMEFWEEQAGLAQADGIVLEEPRPLDEIELTFVNNLPGDYFVGRPSGRQPPCEPPYCLNNRRLMSQAVKSVLRCVGRSKERLGKLFAAKLRWMVGCLATPRKGKGSPEIKEKQV